MSATSSLTTNPAVSPPAGASDTTAFDIRHHAARTPDRTAIVCGAQTMSYAELEALANRLASVFRGLGLVRGDHLAVLLPNRPEMLALAWAAWRCGLYMTPMSTALTTTELAYLVADCDARAVVVDATLAQSVETLPAMLDAPAHWLSMGGDMYGSTCGLTPIEPLLEVASPLPAADEPPGALMMYTSGTTGAPKGVIRPLLPADWRGTPTFAGDLLTLFDLAGDDVRYLSTAPLYHAAPLRYSLSVTAGGGCVVVMQRFEARQALRLLVDQRITHSQWVPAMFQRMLALPDDERQRFKAPSHRCAIHAAAPCPPELKRAMIDWWGLILLEYYAGSEGVGMTQITSAEALQRPGSVGRAVKGVIHIVDDAGTELPAGRTGLVCFSGVAAFAYYKAPEKTAARTQPQGWQTLGDIGHVDAEGYLFLSDRLDDMIISGGVNVYPQEIEAAIRQVPGVADCAAVGVADERFGETPVVFVVPNPVVPNHAGGATGLVRAIEQHCAQHLGKFKRPSRVLMIDELPRSATGKLLRRVLRERL